MKKVLILFLVLALLFCMTSCGKTKILHCDHCNAEIEVDANSNMDESWLVYCEECDPLADE